MMMRPTRVPIIPKAGDADAMFLSTVTLRVFIDTWVTEGHEQGDGWLFDAEIEFQGGAPPSPEAIAVVPVWGHLSWYAGLDDNPVEEQVIPQTVSLPEGSAYTFRSFITVSLMLVSCVLAWMTEISGGILKFPQKLLPLEGMLSVSAEN